MKNTVEIEKVDAVSTMRKGFTMVELMLVILVGGILILAGIQGYNKIYVPAQADSDVKKAGFVLGGVERVKNNLNGGAYLAQASTTITGIQALQDALGGTSGTNDVAGWTYACPAGTGQTITITTNAYTDAAKQRAVIAGINSQYAPWTAAANGTSIDITRTATVCQ